MDYESVVMLAKSVNVNVIRTPNTELSFRHYKKIMAAAGHKIRKSDQAG
jgi:hypothetical protein